MQGLSGNDSRLGERHCPEIEKGVANEHAANHLGLEYKY